MLEPLLGRGDELHGPSDVPLPPPSRPGRLAALAAALARVWAAVVGLVRRMLGLPPPLTPTQRRRWERLAARVGVPYAAENPDHILKLQGLWSLSFPSEPFPSEIKSPRWKELGWQSDDPGRDFRGAGVLSLDSILFFSRSRPSEFLRLATKASGTRVEWEYPFAAAGVNVTHELTQLLGLQAGRGAPSAGPPRAVADLLSETDEAFETLVIYGLQVLDSLWLKERASYMEFPGIMA